MKWFDILKSKSKNPRVSVQTARGAGGMSGPLDSRPLRPPEAMVYEGLCRSVPIIDAALEKIVRLTGGFDIQCRGKAAQRLVDHIYREIPVGASQQGLEAFAASYLRSLITYGNAVGEMVLSPEGESLAALYLPALTHLEIAPGQSPLEAKILVGVPGGRHPLPYPELVLFSALNPRPGEVTGQSLLAGLPFLADILMEIFQAMGNNFQRIGSLRYAVTYKPTAGDRGATQEIAENIAREWSAAMAPGPRGEVRDFVAVGDVDIRVIGADNQFIDTQVPVRQILEQMVAKLGIPPFLLGLSWSTTERMSRQQADILTSELESYRHLLTPVLEAICKTALALAGIEDSPRVLWDNISLQDETEMAAARLSNARAAQLEGSTAQHTDAAAIPAAGLRNGGEA